MQRAVRQVLVLTGSRCRPLKRGSEVFSASPGSPMSARTGTRRRSIPRRNAGCPDALIRPNGRTPPERRYSPCPRSYRTSAWIILNMMHYIRISEETQDYRRSVQRKVADKIAVFERVLRKLAKTACWDCSMGRGKYGARSSQQAQQASTRLRILRCSGPLPEQSKLLAGARVSGGDLKA